MPSLVLGWDRWLLHTHSELTVLLRDQLLPKDNSGRWMGQEGRSGESASGRQRKGESTLGKPAGKSFSMDTGSDRLLREAKACHGWHLLAHGGRASLQEEQSCDSSWVEEQVQLQYDDQSEMRLEKSWGRCGELISHTKYVTFIMKSTGTTVEALELQSNRTEVCSVEKRQNA